MFERLTHKSKYGIAYTKIAANESNMVDVGECYTGRIIDRLAAYEDTGLTPERIRELQNAFNILFESERQKQQENEQLRAQVAQYREALIIANHRMPDVEALSDTPADYHNSADVEALRKAREALKQGINQLEKYINRFEQTLEEDACIEMHEAVLKIDKAIGGKEDA